MNCLGSWRAGTVLTSVSSTFLPYVWGFENIFAKTNHSFYFSIGSLMSLTMYIYPHQGITCFHPTSKDGLCVAHGRRKWKHALVSHVLQNQTKDPWRWQIKQADQDRAHMWKVDGRNGILLLWISLSFIWISWGHGYIDIFFFFFFFFHGHWCVHFFWVMLLGHAIFSLSFFW